MPSPQRLTEVVATAIGCRQWGTVTNDTVSWIAPIRFDGTPGSHVVHLPPDQRPYRIDDLLAWLDHHAADLRYGRTTTPTPSAYWVRSDDLCHVAPSLLGACELAVAALTIDSQSKSPLPSPPTSSSQSRR